LGTLNLTIMNKKADQYTSDILSEIFAEITPREQKRTDNRMLLAAKIKDGMNAKGWRNKQLAEALEQNPSVITKWLSGTHNFTSDTLSDIEEVLSISLLDVHAKKETQIVHYHVQISSVIVSTKQDNCIPSATINQPSFSIKGSKQVLC
jgi:ribosome-binding protein aMBF1 (putative translation factor)